MDGPEKKSRILTWRGIAVIAAGVIVAGLIAFFVLFSVETVLVEGNVIYTEDEIKKLCLDSPLAGNSVLFPTCERRIDLSTHDFLDHVTVEYVDMHTIRLNVVEKQLVGVFCIGGLYYYFDQSGTVTEVLPMLDESQKKYVPLIYGLTASNIGLGYVIDFESDSVLSTIIAIRNMVGKYDICPDDVYFDYTLNIFLHYGDITVNLGQDQLLEEKMARTAAILPGLEGYKGTLHLETFTTDTENIVFDTK